MAALSLKSTLEDLEADNQEIQNCLARGLLDDSLLVQMHEQARDENSAVNSPASPNKSVLREGSQDEGESPVRAEAIEGAEEADEVALEEDEYLSSETPEWLTPPLSTMAVVESNELVSYPPEEDCWVDDTDPGYTEIAISKTELNHFLPPPSPAALYEDDTPTASAAAHDESGLQPLIGETDDDDSPGNKVAPYESNTLRVLWTPKVYVLAADKHDGCYQPGAVLGFRYEVVRLLGQGTFATVFECRNMDRGGEPVAVKQVRNEDPITFLQSLQELRILEELNAADVDKNKVVRVLDSFFWTERLYIVTELLGENLFDLYEQAEQGDRRATALLNGRGNLKKMSRQILEALSFVHSRGMIHADIKPENIVLKRSNNGGVRVKLIDFGCSCSVEEPNKPSYMASRPYRAPECILGAPSVDGAVDVWAVAAVIYELATRRVLFHAETERRVLARLVGICGPIPQWMLEEGRKTKDMVRGNVLFEVTADEEGHELVSVLYPRPCTLEHRMPHADPVLVAFLKSLLVVDRLLRPTAHTALDHEWLQTTAD